MSTDGRLFLGLDSSTQGLKMTAVDDGCQVVYSAAVNYESDLPHFRTEKGMVYGGASGGLSPLLEPLA